MPIVHHFGSVQVIKPASAPNFTESTKLVGHHRWDKIGK